MNEFLKLEDIRTYKDVAVDQTAYTGKIKGYFPQAAAGGDDAEEAAEIPAVGYA